MALNTIFTDVLREAAPQAAFPPKATVFPSYEVFHFYEFQAGSQPTADSGTKQTLCPGGTLGCSTETTFIHAEQKCFPVSNIIIS